VTGGDEEGAGGWFVIVGVVFGLDGAELEFGEGAGVSGAYDGDLAYSGCCHDLMRCCCYCCCCCCSARYSWYYDDE